MQKARHQAFRSKLQHSPLTACRHVVSGSLSSPCRGSSHLSLALLRSLSVTREYLALRDGPRGFRPASTCLVLLRYRLRSLPRSRTGLSPSVVWLSRPLPLGYQLPKCRPYNPQRRTPGFGLFRFRSPLLTESLLLSLPPGTEMFQFPSFAPVNYGFADGSFRDPGINSRLTDPPGLSQSSTPFIASWCQGIPHTPLVAWPR